MTNPHKPNSAEWAAHEVAAAQSGLSTNTMTNGAELQRIEDEKRAEHQRREARESVVRSHQATLNSNRSHASSPAVGNNISRPSSGSQTSAENVQKASLAIAMMLAIFFGFSHYQQTFDSVQALIVGGGVAAGTFVVVWLALNILKVAVQVLGVVIKVAFVLCLAAAALSLLNVV